MWIEINDDGNFCKLNIFEEILDQRPWRWKLHIFNADEIVNVAES